MGVFNRFESNLKRYIRKNKLKPEDRLFNITDRQVRNLVKKYAKKPGYTQIIVRSEARRALEELARLQGYRTVNSLLEAMILNGVNPGVYPTTINEAINEEIRRSETGFKTGFLQERKCRNVVSALEPRAGFEPATSALPRRCPDRLGHRGFNDSSPFPDLKLNSSLFKFCMSCV